MVSKGRKAYASSGHLLPHAGFNPSVVSAPSPYSNLHVEYTGRVVEVMKRYPHLIRKSNGDTLSEKCFTGAPWSALRILRIIGMDSDDDEEICIAAEASKQVVAIIRASLSNTDRSWRLCRRLCPCRRNFSLGWIALQLGQAFWVPLTGGQYARRGSLELARLRTFFPSTERAHVLYLEFEATSKRAEQKEPGGQIPKIVVELYRVLLSIEDEIRAKGIAIALNEDEN
ncbi:hypothetical protein A1O7_09611 [Cladophialophora yegresii CBS 114405]|uniref:Uncharacterized protein n=1 Tax=Cladophialophora yegresii CBS 114405 TaxID=1182544 RepID=W9VFK5_9EURO|nr:uncharacterized protein A1O7_09611 [Cladophialophora yegresii CBS 114405]EXJ54273.1 hypothetical protein A1O7_09611 [Cladophialophora yegresii CBS 114405]